MRYLLDSNVVIALLNDLLSRAARRAKRERVGDLGIPAIVAHELFHGAFKSRREGQNLTPLDALLFPIVEFDGEDARASGLIRAQLGSQGVPIGPYDVLIAGQAIARDLIVVTHNMREFSRVPGLQIENWEA